MQLWNSNQLFLPELLAEYSVEFQACLICRRWTQSDDGCKGLTNWVNTVPCYGLCPHCTDSIDSFIFSHLFLPFTVNITVRSQVFVDCQREVTCLTHTSAEKRYFSWKPAFEAQGLPGRARWRPWLFLFLYLFIVLFLFQSGFFVQSYLDIIVFLMLNTQI